MNNTIPQGDQRLFADLSPLQAVALWEYVRFTEELLEYALSCAGSMDAGILYGFTSRIGALRDDLADALPPDPRSLAPGKQIITFPLAQEWDEP
ncbi:MAG: hypothetical protein LBJ24_01790 [Treponema sp.]|jgi:hypothetical protein|nr:hypothetical protein [Treponema sp.]